MSGCRRDAAQLTGVLFGLLQALAQWTLRHRVLSIGLVLTSIGGLLFYHSLPRPLFRTPHCTVLNDRDGQLLAATVASDGQYRFPAMDSVPTRFAACVLAYEDRHFYWHPGINPVSIVKAFAANVRAGRVVRGGSTLTMQVARMMHAGAERSLLNKAIESVWALRLECSYTKGEILSLYASHAPFGGNVVGLDAAAWRYYRTSPWNLSWGQMASLAVLPNAPGSIFPGARSQAYLRKRNRLLARLRMQGTIDELTYELAIAEPLPQPAETLPQHALHLVAHAARDGREGQTVNTSIDAQLQRRVEEIVQRHAKALSGNKTHNVGVIVAEVESGQVLAYVGNVPSLRKQHEGYVNTVVAQRSSGSILKPLLYAAMLDEGLMLPHELIADVPTKIGSFAPKNSDHTYNGAVPAAQALSRSLNIPSVRMLRRYGIDPFRQLLASVGFTSFTKPASHYGLSLILGGGECSLWEAVGVYASLARIATRYQAEGNYFHNNIHGLSYVDATPEPLGKIVKDTPLGAGAIYLLFKALREVNRPEEEAGWHYFSSSRAVAWKTGTSYGSRDAWAVGVNPRYAVGVWVGNATGQGQTGISGVRSAAPIMFEVWGALPRAKWFEPPLDDLIYAPICRASGMVPNRHCPAVDTVLIPNRDADHAPCPYHSLHYLDSTGRWRVNADCYSVRGMRPQVYFTLPPSMAWYYARSNNAYTPLPPWLPGCSGEEVGRSIQFIYPRTGDAYLSVPRDRDGNPTGIVFEVAHQDRESVLYWHLDGQYVGRTVHAHQLTLLPTEGEHQLTVVDGQGHRGVMPFTVVYSAVNK